jgi:hypothetical protein
MFMNATADLDAALQFVIRRVKEEAIRSCEPLTEEQAWLLECLPSHSVFAESADPETATPIPRDVAYERLCELAKTAHAKDIQADPDNRDWLFAASVLALNSHPMVWLLSWAGAKPARPWWDRSLLLIGAVLLIAAWLTVYLLLDEQPWIPSRVMVVAMSAAIFVLAGLGTRRLDRWELKRTIRECRHHLTDTLIPR